LLVRDIATQSSCFVNPAWQLWNGSAWNAPSVWSSSTKEIDVAITVCWDLNGAYALAVWHDTFVLSGTGYSDLVGNVWNPATLTFGPNQVIQPAGTPQTAQNYIAALSHRKLAQDPVSGDWIVGYRKTGGYFTPSNLAAYRRLTVTGGGVVTPSCPEVFLSNNTQEVTYPIPSFTPAGAGAIFWSERIGGAGQDWRTWQPRSTRDVPRPPCPRS
jgi:hypothetical protein